MPATPAPIRRRAVPRAGAWLRVGLIIALLLPLFFIPLPGAMPSGSAFVIPFREATRFWSALFNAGHALLFGIVALQIRRLLAARVTASAPVAALAAFGIALLVGAATEVLQALQSTGDPSVEDLLRDACGAAAFLLPGAAAGVSRRARVATVAAAVALLAAAGAELAVTITMYRARAAALPTLYAFDGSWWERRWIRPGRSTLVPGDAPPRLAAVARTPLARLDLTPGLYPGITLDEPYPDWRGYRRLVLIIVSDRDAPLDMTVRVHDVLHDQRYGDRFNRRLEVAPGVNRFVIAIDDIRTAPDRRDMDLARIEGIVLFAYRLERPVRIYLGPIRLE